MALRVLLWVARILSIFCILLTLLFYIGEGFNPQNVAPQEWVGLLFFPLGVVAGMVIAWWREGLGGLITTLSLLAFYLIYGLLLSGRLAGGWAFVSLSAPGLLFLAYWLLKNMPGGEEEKD